MSAHNTVNEMPGKGTPEAPTLDIDTSSVEEIERAIGIALPRSRLGLARYLLRINFRKRLIAASNKRMTTKIEQARKEAAAEQKVLAEEAEKLFVAVSIYSHRHRGELTDNGSRKSAEFSTGKVGWRFDPPSIDTDDDASVVKACREAGREDFIRVIEEPNREAMLNDLQGAAQIPGVTIVRVEQFFVKLLRAKNPISRTVERLKHDLSALKLPVK